MSSNTPLISGEYNINVNIQDTHIMRKSVDKYTILNLTNGNSTEPDNVPAIPMEDTSDLQKYYSVVISSETGRLLSVAPPFPQTFDTFTEKYPSFTDEMQIVSMNEGTMIQLFYNPAVNEWEIATKGNVGGNFWHYRTEYKGCVFQPQRTFRQMFYDAIANCFIVGTPMERVRIEEQQHYEAPKTEYDVPLSANPFIQQLDKEYCYTFMLKHPSNPIVHVTFLGSITLISAHKIKTGSTEHDFSVEVIPPSELGKLIPEKFNRIIQLQKIVTDITIWKSQSLRDAVHEYPFWLHEPGVMIINVRTGERTVWENVAYAYFRGLRGNHRNLQYQYFELARNGQLDTFKRYFPGFTRLFEHFQHQYMQFVYTVHANYVKHYIHREPADRKYAKLIAQIHHNVFIQSMARGERTVVTLNEVLMYYNNLAISQLVYIMNNDA
jgi:hypothetical protein